MNKKDMHLPSRTLAQSAPKKTRSAVMPAAQPEPESAAVDTLLNAIVGTLEDGKAEDIVTIDLAGKTTLADHMVIASGRSTRQVSALAQQLIDTLKNDHKMSVGVEGLAQADWVLVDAGDVIVHLFRPEVRSFYNVEKMWSVEMAGAARPAPDGSGTGA